MLIKPRIELTPTQIAEMIEGNSSKPGLGHQPLSSKENTARAKEALGRAMMPIAIGLHDMNEIELWVRARGGEDESEGGIITRIKYVRELLQLIYRHQKFPYKGFVS
jgi:hypothetical protein